MSGSATRPLLASVVALSLSSSLLVLSSCGGSSPATVQPSANSAQGTASYQLSVTVPTAGAGTVTSSPSGIKCPGACTASFAENTQVKLTATPASSDFFAGWSGGCAGAAACSVTMKTSATVTANFSLGETLTVSMAGGGSGIVTSTPAGINCPTTCTASFPANTQVTLSETASSSNVFAAWSGACSGSAACSVTLTAAGTVTATFTPATSTTGGGTSSGAYVYVSSYKPNDSSDVEVYGYTVGSGGSLTPLSGSPFLTSSGVQAANEKYLFGSNGTDVVSFSLAPNGSFERADSIDALQFNSKLSNGTYCGAIGSPFLDRTGTTVYDNDFDSDCANNSFQSFTTEASTGGLNYLGDTTASSPVFYGPLSFIGNNEFGYGALCYHFDPSIYGFKRNGNGALTLVNINVAPVPAAPDGGFYCTYLAATDAANHVAVGLYPLNDNWESDGPPQLATYTAGSSGKLTTTSTYSNMPKLAVGSVASFISISPSGQLVAVAGALGFQVLHFNGANPITPYTKLLALEEIDQLAWDNDNHLFAIDQSNGKVFVFTVTPTSYSEAPGSPYNITNAQNILVVPQ